MILSDNVNNKVCILPLVREQQGYELQLNTNIFRRTFPLQPPTPENGDFPEVVGDTQHAISKKNCLFLGILRST